MDIFILYGLLAVFVARTTWTFVSAGMSRIIHTTGGTE